MDPSAPTGSAPKPTVRTQLSCPPLSDGYRPKLWSQKQEWPECASAPSALATEIPANLYMCFRQRAAHSLTLSTGPVSLRMCRAEALSSKQPNHSNPAEAINTDDSTGRQGGSQAPVLQQPRCRHICAPPGE
eukprot:GHVU01151200.1.p3 GENE.GHVU01151200.1~~GHVU01151200.1.p3  ORF type:complete len:132 (-),score=17.62 GHVU01151200.1:1454-1849(-)